MQAKYKHTNIIARDWRRLASFYEQVFGCVLLQPERALAGLWLEKGTGVADASLSGAHLRLPGGGVDGPTLEILQYTHNEPKPSPAANREGYAHIGFAVDDVETAVRKILEHGGSMVGDVSTSEVPGVGTLTFVYVADPEGNIIEIQTWT